MIKTDADINSALYLCKSLKLCCKQCKAVVAKHLVSCPANLTMIRGHTLLDFSKVKSETLKPSVDLQK